MGLTTALNTAMSGLTAAARQAQVTSANIANAMTEGYVPRQIGLSAAALGGVGNGVRVTGILRQGDPVLASLTRSAAADLAAAEVTAQFRTRLEAAVGLPDSPGSLGDQLARFEAALVSATARPDLQDRLAAVGDSARGLATTLNRLEDAVQAQRLDADAALARDIGELAVGLMRVADLNMTIRKLELGGQSPLGLQDERDQLLLSLSRIVPLRVLPRPDGQVRLYSEGGLLLLDGAAPTIDFSAAPGMTSSMSLDNAMLSGLSIDGRAVDTGPNGPLSGGRLAALFTLRDHEGPAVQAALDNLAADLIARFEDPSTDPSNAPGNPGLFTDAGMALAPPAPAGLAGRLRVTDLIDPAAGGALWRLRDGLGASPGPVGDAEQLNRWIGALERPRAAGPGAAATDLAGAAGGLLASLSLERQRAEDHSVYARIRHDAVHDDVRARGVDTDAELQRLLLVEQAHAANARVIQAVDEMLRRLMEI